MFIDLILFVFKDINRRKFSSFLTFFAISLGIFSIYLIVLISIGFQQSVAGEFEKLGSNRLFISESLDGPTSTKGLDDNTIKLIERKSYIEKVYPYYSRGIQVKYANKFKNVQVLGTNLDQDYLDDINVKVAIGRAPKLNEKFSVIIGPSVGELKYDKEIPVGSNLFIKGTKFKVVGILESIGNPQDDSTIFTNIDTLRDLFNDQNSVGLADVIVNENEDVKLAAENLKITLDNRLGEDKVEIISPEQILEQAGSILTIIQSTLGGIALVSLFVGAFGIINTMYVIVSEKTKEIGIMKAIGATNEMVLFIYVFQAGLYGLLGGILGISFGSFAAIVFESVAKSAGYTFLEISISFTVIFVLLIFSFIVGVLSGFLPAREASKLIIVDTFRK